MWCISENYDCSVVGYSNSWCSRSLLGLDDDTNKRLLYAEEAEDVFDRETELDIEKLGAKAAEMKDVCRMKDLLLFCD